MAMATTTWTKTPKPSKATAPAMVTVAPWVATWSHWNNAATRAAAAVRADTTVPTPTPTILRSSDDTTTRTTAPPIMIRMGRMLR